MPCYPTCKSCSDIGNIYNHKCTQCYDNYTLNKTNCYKICKYYYYFDSSNVYHFTLDNSCPNGFNKLIKEKNQCIENCDKDDTYIMEYNNRCYINCPKGTKIIKNRNNNNNICFEEFLCSEKNPYKIIETDECSKNCSAINFFKGICKINNDIPKIKDEMINTIKNDLINGDLNSLIIPNIFELN